MKVTKFGGNRPKTKKVINRQTKFTQKTPPPVLIGLIQYIAHYRVSKVMRKHTKLNHSHPDCFTNNT